MKGADVDETRKAMINDYNARLRAANDELKTANQRKDQYQSELFEQRQQQYYMRQEFQTEDKHLRQQLQAYQQRLQQHDSTTRQGADEMQQRLQHQQLRN